jgi:hypothetical protein
MFKTVALFAIACVFPITVAVAQNQPGHTQHHSQDTQPQEAQTQGGQTQPGMPMMSGQMSGGQTPMSQGAQTPMGGQGQMPMGAQMPMMPMMCGMMGGQMQGGQMQGGQMQGGQMPMQGGRMPMMTMMCPMMTAQMMPMPMMGGRTVSAADAGYMQAMQKMQQNMMTLQMTGDATGDFVRMMIAHHQGAIDMAKVLLQLKDVSPEIRPMAEKIIADQQKEIESFQQWLAKQK